MLELYVMRHAKSSWDNSDLNDHDRPLSNRGKRNAKTICEFFVKKKIYFDLILVSSSKRTKKTLKILLNKIDKPKKIITSKKLYLAHENDILKKIRTIDKHYKKILLINHEPAVRNLSLVLSKNTNNHNYKLMNYKFPTAAYAKIIFNLKDWSLVNNNGNLTEFIRPKDIQDSRE